MRERARRDASGLRLRARRDVTTVLTGAYRSAFRGSGLTFEELRDYVPGDDVRWIEWNATARHGRPIVKRMREERDLVLALLVDVSDSLEYGFRGQTKARAARRAAAALATAAIGVQDRVALATFADGLRETLMPARGALQLERIFRALEQEGIGVARTDAGPAFHWAVSKLPRHAVVVLLSDFLFGDPGASLRQCARKHEVVALELRDLADLRPRGTTTVRVHAAEGGASSLWRRGRAAEGERLSEGVLRALAVDVGGLWTGARLVPSLHRFFERRARAAPRRVA